MERRGITTMKGNPMTLVGPGLQPGDKAPDFLVLDQTMAPKTLKDYAGKFKVISVTPSLDTPVCDLQIHWFNEDASKQPQDVAVLNISMDLPFAIKRFCATGMPFWDFVGPLLPSALLLGLTVLYFMRRRLDDLTTVAQTRLPRKSRKRAHRGG